MLFVRKPKQSISAALWQGGIRNKLKVATERTVARYLSVVLQKRISLTFILHIGLQFSVLVSRVLKKMTKLNKLSQKLTCDDEPFGLASQTPRGWFLWILKKLYPVSSPQGFTVVLFVMSAKEIIFSPMSHFFVGFLSSLSAGLHRN